MRARALIIAATAVALAATTGPAGLATTGSSAAEAGPQAPDFNGDGRADLAVAAPAATVGGHGKAGRVSVVYGTGQGLDPAKNQAITQSTAGVPGTPETNDRFGSDPVTGDLDADGFTDLVVSARGEDLGTVKNAGFAVVLWGSPQGLTGGMSVKPETPVALADFGVDAVADFDDDGNYDLVNAGSAVVSEPGRVDYGPFNRSTGAAGSATLDATLDGFGFPVSTATGDLDGDGRDDLAVVVDIEHEEFHAYWFRGTPEGLVPKGRISVGGSDPFIESGTEGVIADFDGDGYGDFAEHVPGVSEGEGGELIVFPGGPDGPGAESYQISQETPGVHGVSEEGDDFGWRPAAGDVDGDGYMDVIVGGPGEDDSAGRVVLLRGGPEGLTGTGSQSMGQNAAGVPGVSEPYDEFGWDTSMADFDGDGQADLATSAVGENSFEGAVWTVESGDGGFDPAQTIAFGPAKAGGIPEAGQRFGADVSP